MGNIKKIKVNGTTHDVRSDAYVKPSGGIPASDIATGVIPDVSAFITKSVNDLVNYYTKSQTYTQTEVNSLIGAINQFRYEIAASTSAVTDPQSNVLYLIGPTGSGSDKYEEYVYPNSTTGWTKIGDTTIDLSGYVTTTALNTALSGKENTSNKVTSLSNSSTDTQYPSAKCVYDSIASHANAVNITWSALKTLRDNNQLIPGRQYRITDYITTVDQEGTRSAGHQFDVIVVADSTNKLNESARAILHSGDTYFATAKLESWEIKYCLDNDKTRFTWANSVQGKGVIYWMKDEWNNECDYDFKNIQFKRYDVTGFTLNRGPNYNDLSARVEEWFYSVKNTLPYRFYRGYSDPKSGQDAVDAGYAGLLGVDEEEILESGLNYCIIDDPEWMADPGLIASFDYSIKFDWFYTFTNRINNVNSDKSLAGGLCYNNVVESRGDLYDNIFLSDSLYGACHNNAFGENCYCNTFGYYCSYNTLGNYCYYNTFGSSCVNNTFRRDCHYNTFGNNCVNNTFGELCYSNTFGENCNYNTFGNRCKGNTFGNYNDYNTFGNDSDYNTFGNYCNSIMFDKNYIYNVIIENGSQHITITSTQTTSISNKLRNFTIAQGVDTKTVSHNTVNDTFQTVYQSANSQTINV